MGFLVYGNDARTGEVAPRFYSSARTEADARLHGTERGMAVMAVVPCADDRGAPDLGESAATFSQVESELDAPVIAAREFRRELLACSPHIYVTYALIAANCAVFVAMVISGISAISPTTAEVVGWAANWGPLTTDGEWWRLVASLFVHIGILHLLANMLAFALVAPTVERMVGSTTFLLLYLVAGIGGGMFSLYWSPLRPEVGASGAIFGIYGVLVGLLLRERGSLGKQTQLKSFLFYFISYNLLYSLLPNVSLTAHLGGLLTGFLGTFMVVRGPLPATARLEVRRNILVVFYGVALVALAGAALHYRYGELGSALIDNVLASKRQTPDATFIFLGILELAGAGFSAFLIERGLRDIILGGKSRRWPDTLGQIESANVAHFSDRFRRLSYTAKLRYSYNVDGQTYIGTRIGFGLPGGSGELMSQYSRSRSDVEHLMLRYPVGRRIPVYYSPNSPEVSVLEPGTNLNDPATFLIVGLGLLAISGFAAMALLMH